MFSQLYGVLKFHHSFPLLVLWEQGTGVGNLVVKMLGSLKEVGKERMGRGILKVAQTRRNSKPS